jgi:adenine-specific DNA-methyltransferase
MTQPEKMEITSMDVAAQKREEIKKALGEAFPAIFSDNKIDFDQLRRALGDLVDSSKERYGLQWSGKAACMTQVQQLTTATLKPDRNASVDFDNSNNILIEGDNFEVLKTLQKSYYGKVKMIYIDPPYNTGRNLIYPNDYQDGLRTYLEVTGQVAGGKKLISNPDTGGRFHTNWLSMIYPRLILARNLLRQDGVLVITIDDNEQTTLGMLLKEVFDEGSFEHVCIPVVHNPRGVQGKNFSYVHEYAFFVYPSDTKSIANRKIDESEIDWSQFRNWGTESERSDAKNCFYPVIVKDGAIIGFGDVCPDDFHPEQTVIEGDTAYVYPIDRSGVERKWRYAKQSADSIKHLLRAKKIADGYEIEIGKDFGLYKTIWNDKRYDANEYGTKIVGDLVPNSPFTFPKSLWVVYDTVLAVTLDDPDAIVMDFFAGSGTTAHAVMQLNRDVGGNRKFIMVQLPEKIDDNPDFESIFDVTRARIAEAGRRIKESDPLFSGDTGFRTFRLGESNFKVWNGNPDAFDEQGKQLEMHVDHIDQSSSADDILFELLLKAGYPLTTKVETIELAGKSVFSISEGAMLICLEKEITPELIDALAEANPMRVICLDAGFNGNDQLKANAVQTFKARAQAEESEIVFRTV